MGMPLLRRSLARAASGHVLEASAGTGRNNRYYDTGKCESITFVDSSIEMLKIAQKDFYSKLFFPPPFLMSFYFYFSTLLRLLKEEKNIWVEGGGWVG